MAAQSECWVRGLRTDGFSGLYAVSGGAMSPRARYTDGQGVGVPGPGEKLGIGYLKPVTSFDRLG